MILKSTQAYVVANSYYHGVLKGNTIMSDMTRVRDLDDPNRCLHNPHDGSGQCLMKAVEGGNRCKVHGGGRQLQVMKKKQLRAYAKNKWAAAIKENANDSEIKSLREELGIARIMLDQILNRCKDSHDLLMFSAPIDNFLKTINLIQKTSHAIEKDLSEMIGPEALNEFAETLFSIIMDEIDDANVIERISLKLGRALQKMQSGTPDKEDDDLI